MTTGTIKFVAPTGRFGMIARDDREPKVFVHLSEVLVAGETRLEKGQRFEFEVGHDGDGRPSASKLRRI